MCWDCWVPLDLTLLTFLVSRPSEEASGRPIIERLLSRYPDGQNPRFHFRTNKSVNGSGEIGMTSHFY